MKRNLPDRISRHVAPFPRFIAGMLMLPAFLLTESLILKAVLAVFFVLLALLSGKRIRTVYFLILILSVTFFHLLSPRGRVFFEIASFPVTSGALKNGLIRGVSLAGMVFLSVAAVSSGLHLPGRFGGLLSRTFFYFDSILEGEKRLSAKNFFNSLDELLMERFNPDLESLKGKRKPEALNLPGRFRGWIPASLSLVIPWGLFFWTLLGDSPVY